MSPLTKSGTLQHGLKVGDQVHKEFEMREALAGDFFAAEADAIADKPMSYRGALIARQLVRVGTFEGPFTMGMLGRLKGSDFAILLQAQRALDEAGEGPQLAGTAG